MSGLLWVVVLAPFAGALILALAGSSMSKRTAGAIGCASIGVAWVVAMVAGVDLVFTRPGGSMESVIYRWINAGGLQVEMGLHLDALSLVMMLVVTFVGFLIHLYAAQSMYEEDGYSRFFTYMNLFVGSMLTLVLADNLLLLFLGWEGVGLCSYLLIGFWYKDTANGYAAQKAFIVTRVGDTAFAVALFILYWRFGTLNIQQILAAAPAVLVGGGAAVIAYLLLGGAVGKSAQIPLQTWLPDAMAGPTPVSALIHAATMVTAGVYLIARMHVIFQMAPIAMLAVAVVGTATLFYSGFSALVQRDIKRVLAYSTISQIGYMFLALGVGAWTAAMFHFLTHAFFKALLFLSAGVVIDAQHHEHDMLKMGGLRTRLPVAFWTFLVGAASLSALPIVTAGFFSKDAIIWASYSSSLGSTWFWVLGLLAALITGIYSFRALFLTFFGEQKMEISKYPGGLMKFVLIVLAFFSITIGYLGWPELLLHYNPFGEFMARVFPAIPAASPHPDRGAEAGILTASVIESFLGIFIAYLYFRGGRWAWLVERSRVAQAVHRFFVVGWGFDWLYNWLFVQPYRAITYANRQDIIDKLFLGLGEAARYSSIGLSWLQTGRVRNYAAGLAVGAIILAVVALLTTGYSTP